MAALALSLPRWLCFCALGWMLLFSQPAAAAAGTFVHTRVEGVINPIKVRQVGRAVERARSERAQLLLLTIDTPGGLVTSMQEIVASLSNAGLPVVVFAAPRSAQATSAGAFILLAGELAAMAPGTRVGSAHPVADGKALDAVLDKKATNSLAALMKSLAERRGRPAALAEGMVRESTSYTAEDALAKQIIEVVAADEAELLRKLDGRELRGGRKLSTRGLTRIDLPVSAVDQALDRLADPTLTSLLVSIGVLAIVYELGTAGVGAGGAIGAVLLVLGLLGSSVLPIELSALALAVIGAIAIALEVKLPTHGILGGAGVIALIVGGMLIVDPDAYFGGLRAVNLALFGPIVLVLGIGFLLLTRVTRRALEAPPVMGLQALVGRRGTARAPLFPGGSQRGGQVLVDGARWQAESTEGEIAMGEVVEVVAVSSKPTRLIVRRVS